MPATQIALVYRSVDGFRERKTFKTVAGARRYAVSRVGKNPDFGSDYAVSDDGIGTIRVRGCTLRELFHDEPKPAPVVEMDYQLGVDYDDQMFAAAFGEPTPEVEADPYAQRRTAGCTCSDMQLNHVGCECGAEEVPAADPVVLVDCWWDPQTTSYVIQSKDERGFEVGDATYVGTALDAGHEVGVRKARHPAAKVVCNRYVRKHVAG